MTTMHRPEGQAVFRRVLRWPVKASGTGAVGTLQVAPHYVYADQIDTARVITRASDQAVVWRWDQAEAFGATPTDDNPSGLSGNTQPEQA